MLLLQLLDEFWTWWRRVLQILANVRCWSWMRYAIRCVWFQCCAAVLYMWYSLVRNRHYIPTHIIVNAAALISAENATFVYMCIIMLYVWFLSIQFNKYVHCITYDQVHTLELWWKSGCQATKVQWIILAVYILIEISEHPAYCVLYEIFIMHHLQCIINRRQTNFFQRNTRIHWTRSFHIFQEVAKFFFFLPHFLSPSKPLLWVLLIFILCKFIFFISFLCTLFTCNTKSNYL